MRWLNYHHLIYFRTIAVYGSIARASEVLGVGQPALSSQLKNFEEYLGIKLFERKNRRLNLTEAGKVSLEYANQVHNLGQELLNTIENKSFLKSVQLNVGATDSIPKHLISDIVEFAHKKTGCFLSIIEGDSDTLLRQLQTHQIELIISDHELKSTGTAKIYSQRIYRGNVVAAASPDFASAKRKFPASLADLPCIVPTNHSKLRLDIDNFFNLSGIKPNYIGETQDTSLQKILAVKGDGVVFLPEFAITSYVKQKKLMKLGTLDGVCAEYFLIYGKRVIENPALELLLEHNYFRRPKSVI